MRSAARPRLGNAGLTLVEVVIAGFLGIVVLIGIWFTYSTNQKVWSRGRDKIRLQQSLTQAAEAIGRDVRAGTSVAVMNGGSELRIFDRAGAELRRYYVEQERLSTAADKFVVPETEKCVLASFTIDPDTTQVLFRLTLKDPWENQATIQGSAHLRNIPGFEISGGG